MFLPVFSASILTFVGIDEVLVDMTACGSPVFSWEKMSALLEMSKVLHQAPSAGSYHQPIVGTEDLGGFSAMFFRHVFVCTDSKT